ncbi:hypothetical protein HAX54_043914 [Datura stramonium]|uniref:Uncharacterized protein n=1 Tax=Datura stramonium TaxID=4076 RepID=A0ABS8W1Y1_DATST|nr:hypothetical protein [Datura stramonium]
MTELQAITCPLPHITGTMASCPNSSKNQIWNQSVKNGSVCLYVDQGYLSNKRSPAAVEVCIRRTISSSYSYVCLVICVLGRRFLEGDFECGLWRIACVTRVSPMCFSLVDFADLNSI